MTFVSLDVTTVLMLLFSPIFDVDDAWSKLSLAKAVVGDKSELQKLDGAPSDVPGAALKDRLNERGILDDIPPGLTEPEPFLSPNDDSNNEEPELFPPDVACSSSDWQVWRKRGAFKSPNDAGADRIEPDGEPTPDARLA